MLRVAAVSAKECSVGHPPVHRHQVTDIRFFTSTHTYMFLDFMKVTIAVSLPLLDCISALYSGRTYFMRPCDVTKAITSGTTKGGNEGTITS